MEYTRVDAKKLAAAVARVATLLQQADDALDELTVMLTPKERNELPKPRDGFATVARAIAQNKDLDDLKATVGYESDAVVEDLANLDSLAVLETQLARLQQRLDDSSLLWLAEAYAMTLELYGVARARSKVDARVASAIAPLVAFFTTPRPKKP